MPILIPVKQRHRGPSARVLIIGDVEDLADVEYLLGLLPGDSYGQLYLQAESSSEIRPVAAPCRVTVSWLAPQIADPESAGDRLAATVDAWIEEWLPDTAGGDTPAVLPTMWIGALAAARLTANDRADLLRRFCPVLMRDELQIGLSAVAITAEADPS